MCILKANRGLGVLRCGLVLVLSGFQAEAISAADPWDDICRDIYRATLLENAAADCRQSDGRCNVTISWEQPPREVSPAEADAYAKRLRDNAYTRERTLPRPPASPIANWQNGGKQWTQEEKDTVTKTLNALKDRSLKNWIARKVSFERDPNDRTSPISASGSKLRVKDDFFLRITQARRENLLVFEAGKVFWTETGLTYPFGGSAVTAMMAARHKEENLSDVADPDATSDFGHVFRAQALRLCKPRHDSDLRRRWEAVISEFHKRTARFLEDGL